MIKNKSIVEFSGDETLKTGDILKVGNLEYVLVVREM